MEKGSPNTRVSTSSAIGSSKLQHDSFFLDLRMQILARVSEGSDDPRFPPLPQPIAS